MKDNTNKTKHYKLFKRQIKEASCNEEVLSALETYIHYIRTNYSIKNEEGKYEISKIDFNKIIKAYNFIFDNFASVESPHSFIRDIPHIEGYVVNDWNINSMISKYIVFEDIVFKNAFTNFVFLQYNHITENMPNISFKANFVNCKFIGGAISNIDMRESNFKNCEFINMYISANSVLPTYGIIDCIFTNITRIGHLFPMSCNSLSCTYDETYVYELAVHLYNQCIKLDIYPELKELLLPVAQQFRPDDGDLDEILKRDPICIDGNVKTESTTTNHEPLDFQRWNAYIESNPIFNTDHLEYVDCIKTFLASLSDNQPKDVNIDELEI